MQDFKRMFEISNYSQHLESLEELLNKRRLKYITIKAGGRAGVCIGPTFISSFFTYDLNRKD